MGGSQADDLKTGQPWSTCSGASLSLVFVDVCDCLWLVFLTNFVQFPLFFHTSIHRHTMSHILIP